MLFIIAAVLLVLWLVGLATAFTLGGLLHLLLVVAIVLVIFRLLHGTPPG